MWTASEKMGRFKAQGAKASETPPWVILGGGTQSWTHYRAGPCSCDVSTPFCGIKCMPIIAVDFQCKYCTHQNLGHVRQDDKKRISWLQPWGYPLFSLQQIAHLSTTQNTLYFLYFIKNTSSLMCLPHIFCVKWFATCQAEVGGRSKSPSIFRLSCFRTTCIGSSSSSLHCSSWCGLLKDLKGP